MDLLESGIENKAAANIYTLLKGTHHHHENKIYSELHTMLRHSNPDKVREELIKVIFLDNKNVKDPFTQYLNRTRIFMPDNLLGHYTHRDFARITINQIFGEENIKLKEEIVRSHEKVSSDIKQKEKTLQSHKDHIFQMIRLKLDQGNLGQTIMKKIVPIQQEYNLKKSFQSSLNQCIHGMGIKISVEQSRSGKELGRF